MKLQQSQGTKFPQSAVALIVRCCLNVQVVIADHSSFTEACERVRRSANARCVGRTDEKCSLALSDTKNGSFLLLLAADIGKFANLHTLVDRGGNTA